MCTSRAHKGWATTRTKGLWLYKVAQSHDIYGLTSHCQVFNECLVVKVVTSRAQVSVQAYLSRLLGVVLSD